MSDECLQPVGGEGESEGLTWCALWMATLGLAQLSTTTAAAAATDGVAFSLLPFALIWLVVDVQVLLTLDVLTLWLHLLWLHFTMTPLTVAPVTMALLYYGSTFTMTYRARCSSRARATRSTWSRGMRR